ncbi:MAG: hypothetical protein JWP03_438 [Phycisphaerales bacterium]|nr:hypothetical protein [Phycisphaerales bacterium]
MSASTQEIYPHTQLVKAEYGAAALARVGPPVFDNQTAPFRRPAVRKCSGPKNGSSGQVRYYLTD